MAFPSAPATYTRGNISAFPTCNNHSLSAPIIPGADITSIQAIPFANYSLTTMPYQLWTKSEFTGLDFCNVTVEYTHPGYNDSISVSVLLPQSNTWNGKFLGSGGSGWSAMQGELGTVPAVDAGFSVASTNGGVPFDQLTSADWALLSPGNPDINRLNTFASRALHEMAIVGKSVTKDYYRRDAAYAYWVGCSQGGRQGMMNAQLYPDDYDGIAALAPAINWGQIFAGMNWAHQIMHELDSYPQPCEVLAYQAAAVQACDGLDGLVDGVSSITSCTFNPFGSVGQTFNCNGANATYTVDGARVMNSAWQGPRSTNGDFLWYGYHKDADLSAQVAGTTCSATGHCTATPFSLAEDWLALWVAAEPSFDLSNLTREDFISLMSDGIQRYDSIIGTRNVDLSKFRESGGKMITWHGLADQLIPVTGSTNYHDRVHDIDENVDDYFRLFLAPGTAHCVPGLGHFPFGVLTDLVDWVEQGNAPTQLVAQNMSSIDPTTGRPTSGNATTRGRLLCPYPRVQKYLGGDPDMQSSFECGKE